MFTAFTIVFTLLMGIIDVNAFSDEEYTLQQGSIGIPDQLVSEQDSFGFFKTFVTNVENAPLFINLLIGFVYATELFLLITSLPLFNVN